MTKNAQLARAFLDDSVELIDQSMIKLRNCLKQLSLEQIWWRPSDACNSVGNLILHICGNLRQWTISGIGGLEDARNRELEFSNQWSMSADQLLKHLETETAECKSVLLSLTENALLSSFTIQGFEVNGLQAINHTVTHFVGHTHQIIYITRFQLGDKYEFAWSPHDDRKRLPI